MADKRRYLSKRGDTTSDPKQALRGLPVEREQPLVPDRGEDEARRYAGLEPEAVDPAELAHLPKTAERQRFDKGQAEEMRRRANKSRTTRLTNYQTEAVRLDADDSRILASIDRQLDEYARLLQRRRAA